MTDTYEMSPNTNREILLKFLRGKKIVKVVVDAENVAITIK